MVNLGDAGTFAQLYATLTSEDAGNAWPNFKSAIQNLPGGIVDDDPFGGLAEPTQGSHPAPKTAELVGRIFAAIVTDLAAGTQPEQLIADVRAAMLPAMRPATLAVCQPQSKRLRPLTGVNRTSKTA
jgi:hypothetical protein